jgi:hypothetical protein
MAATVTLSTTTLRNPVSESDQAIRVSSTSGMFPGVWLFVNRELMSVRKVGIDSWVDVSRGQDGTATMRHASGATLTLGQSHQFYASDPIGVPPNDVAVSPWINVITGDSFTAQGDEAGPGLEARWWQKNVATYGVGSLGVRTVTNTP